MSDKTIPVVAHRLAWKYPKYDGYPTPGVPIIILTRGKVPIFGNWDNESKHVAWCLSPLRDISKED